MTSVTREDQARSLCFPNTKATGTGFSARILWLYVQFQIRPNPFYGCAPGIDQERVLRKFKWGLSGEVFVFVFFEKHHGQTLGIRRVELPYLRPSRSCGFCSASLHFFPTVFCLRITDRSV